MVTDLEAKAAKYESKATQYRELALQAPKGPQRSLFEVFAVYYEDLASNFPQAIARRQDVHGSDNRLPAGANHSPRASLGASA